MKNMVLLVLVSMVLFSCNNEKKAKEYFDSAVTKFYNNQNKEAYEDFKKAAEYNPDHEETWYYLGNCEMSFKEYDKAIESFTKAIEINPNYTDAYFNRGNAISTLKGDMKTGCADWQKAAELGRPNMETKLKFCK